MGYVYLITDGQYTKIGVTKNEVDIRTKQHQTGNPFRIQTVYYFSTDNMFAAESGLHKLYATKHVRGEWYDLTDKDIDAIIDMYPNGNVGEAYLSFKQRLRLWVDAILFLLFRK